MLNPEEAMLNLEGAVARGRVLFWGGCSLSILLLLIELGAGVSKLAHWP